MDEKGAGEMVNMVTFKKHYSVIIRLTEGLECMPTSIEPDAEKVLQLNLPDCCRDNRKKPMPIREAD